jgi:hypothetical protein
MRVARPKNPGFRVLPEKWEPVFRKEARQNKKLGSVHDSIETGQTLAAPAPRSSRKIDPNNVVYPCGDYARAEPLAERASLRVQRAAPLIKQFRVCCAAVALGLLSGCASSGQNSNRVQTDPIRCDDAVSQGTAFGRGAARAIAVNSLRNQVADVRGYLLSQGLRRVRPANRSVTCRPSGLGYGLIQCTAVTRYCGN